MTLYRKGVMDFPHAYNQRSPHKKTKFGGGATGDYPVITDEQALDIWAPWTSTLFDDDAAFFFWGCMPKTPVNMEFLGRMEKDGFRFVTCAYLWEKITKAGNPKGGPGHYTAANAEPLWLAVRGKMKPEISLSNSVRPTFGWEATDYFELNDEPRSEFDIVVEPDSDSIVYKTHLTRHSRKPAIFKQLIDAMYPSDKYGRGIGLFERELQSGWDLFGNEVPSDIVGPDGLKPAPLAGDIAVQKLIFA